MIELIRKRLLNGELILNSELLALCNFYDIKLGPRTKGYINTYITDVCIEDKDDDNFYYEFTCTHNDVDNEGYTMPKGVIELINILTPILANKV
jgi:hypothetical protein